MAVHGSTRQEIGAHSGRKEGTQAGMHACRQAGTTLHLFTPTHLHTYPMHNVHAQVLGPRFHVLLVSYETVLKDKSELKKLHYQVCTSCGCVAVLLWRCMWLCCCVAVYVCGGGRQVDSSMIT
jgi:hypothetical protein